MSDFITNISSRYEKLSSDAEVGQLSFVFNLCFHQKKADWSLVVIPDRQSIPIDLHHTDFPPKNQCIDLTIME